MRDITHYRNIHAGSRCFLIGNGPSLRSQDLTKLAREITFTCNRGHLAWYSLMRAPSTYWTVEDALDMLQFGTEFRALTGTTKLVPEDMIDGHRPWHAAVPVPFVRDRFDERAGDQYPVFGNEPPFYWGATVSYLMLQMAAYMGCAPIYLLGHDFAYTTTGMQPKHGTWLVDEDRNHFTRDYWPAGSRAFPANLDLMHRAFTAASAALADGRVVNLTPLTHLDVFPCEDYEEVVNA